MAVDSLRARTPVAPDVLEGDRRTRLLERLAEVRLSRLGTAAFLAVLVLVSLFLRTRALSVHFWVDEGISVGIASHPLSELTHLLREDGSPPLYYLMLHVWMQVFGHSVVATHVLSLIPALLVIPTAYWAGSSLFGRRTGEYGAILATALPFLTGYAQETRMYSLLVLLALIMSAGFLHAFVMHRRRYLPVFAISLTACLYTHNWSLFLGLGTFIGFVICARLTPTPERGRVWRDGALAFGAVAVMYLPWVPTLLYQSQHTGAPWALPPILWSFSQGMYFITGGRGAAVPILLGAGAGLLAVRDAGPGERINRLAIVSLLVLGFGTLLIAWLYAKTTPAWSFRYLAVIVGPLLLLVAFGMARGSRLGAITLALVFCFWVIDPPVTKVDSKENIGSAAAKIVHHTGASTLVLSTQPEQVPVISYYLPRIKHFGTPLGPVADPRVMNWTNALTTFEHTSVRRTLLPMLAKLKPGQRVALVVPVQFADAPRWMELIKKTSASWTDHLKSDRNLKLLSVNSPHIYSAGIPMRISLYEVVHPS